MASCDLWPTVAECSFASVVVILAFLAALSSSAQASITFAASDSLILAT